MKPGAITAHLAGAGLFAGVIAWALHQQASYIIAAWVCGGSAAALWIASGLALLLLAAGAFLSWRAVRTFRAVETAGEDGLRARQFLSSVAIMGALLFLFAIILQAVAVLFLPGCVG